MPVKFILSMALVLLCAACSLERQSAVAGSAGNSTGGVTYREVLGDSCPPGQAAKGNC